MNRNLADYARDTDLGHYESVPLGLLSCFFKLTCPFEILFLKGVFTVYGL